eukprot:TRINITY_DN473_c0_g1_i4.p1 TRINITY_DN473_c0_g1~~TRINITY_DN473_c0_g1_i4.p1  ORF type:complete len:260 (+),score=85.23 TRINITY_DN473_c0_g1_i4:47-826(+)
MDDPEVLEKLIQKAQHSTDDSPVTVTKNGGGRRTNITSTNMKSGEYTALMKRAGAQNGEAWHHSMSIHERRKRELIRRQAEQEEYERCKQQYNQKAALGVQKKAPTIYDTLWGDASAADDSLTKKIKVSVAVVPRDGSKQETAKEKDAEKAKKKHKHKKQKSEDKGTNSQPIAQTESTQSTLLESTRHLNPTANLREQQQQQKQQQQLSDTHLSADAKESQNESKSIHQTHPGENPSLHNPLGLVYDSSDNEENSPSQE